MTYKAQAIAKHPGAHAKREVGYGTTVYDASGNRMAWAPGPQEAWRIAAGQPARSVAA